MSWGAFKGQAVIEILKVGSLTMESEVPRIEGHGLIVCLPSQLQRQGPLTKLSEKLTHIETSHEGWALKEVADGNMALIGSEVTLFHYIGKQYISTGYCHYAVAKEEIIREVKVLAVRPGFPFLARFNTL